MAIDFGGFKEVTDALGGVDLKVERTITSIHKPYRTFTKGTNHMNGAEALDWIRQRKQFPDGDFARMRHQQEFLKALMDKAASTGTLTNPKKLNEFLKSVTAAVTVDQDFSLTDMALQFRNLRGENLTFLTSPQLGQPDDQRRVGGGLRPGEGAGDVQGDVGGHDGRLGEGEPARKGSRNCAPPTRRSTASRRGGHRRSVGEPRPTARLPIGRSAENCPNELMAGRIRHSV